MSNTLDQKLVEDFLKFIGENDINTDLIKAKKMKFDSKKFIKLSKEMKAIIGKKEEASYGSSYSY